MTDSISRTLGAFLAHDALETSEYSSIVKNLDSAEANPSDHLNVCKSLEKTVRRQAIQELDSGTTHIL